MIFLKYFVLSLHVLMVFITALAPVLFYKRKGKCLMKFYLSMAGTAKARKIYRLQLEAWVFLVNLTYYLLNGPNTWQIPAMALSLILMTNTCTSAILRWLHDDKRVQLIACAVFFASLSLPQLYTLSVSVGMVIIWAMFYHAILHDGPREAQGFPSDKGEHRIHVLPFATRPLRHDIP